MSSSSRSTVDIGNITEPTINQNGTQPPPPPPPFPDHVLSYNFYNGVTIRLDRTMMAGETSDATSFRNDLQKALRIWIHEGRKGIWIQVPNHLAYVMVPVNE
jgi:hypothetical protein